LLAGRKEISLVAPEKKQKTAPAAVQLALSASAQAAGFISIVVILNGTPCVRAHVALMRALAERKETGRSVPTVM
jgi:hypothetical protein